MNNTHYCVSREPERQHQITQSHILVNKSFLESILDLDSVNLHDFKVIKGSYSSNYEIHNSKFLFMAMVYNFHVILYLCFLCLMVTTIMHSLHFILCSIVSAPYSYPTKVISSSLAACSCSSLNWEILRHGGSCFILRHFSLVSCLPSASQILYVLLLLCCFQPRKY